MGGAVTPTPLPVGWESTVAPGASPVVIEAISPNAINSVEVAILAVLLFGFSFVILLLALQLVKRGR